VAAGGNRESSKELKSGTSRCWHDKRNCLPVLKSSQSPPEIILWCLDVERSRKSFIERTIRSFAAFRMTREIY
jgi:hypothetical protein